MDKYLAIKELKERIINIHKGTKEGLGRNIFRGHSKVLSSDIEDGIAYLLSEVLPSDYIFIIDPSIY